MHDRWYETIMEELDDIPQSQMEREAFERLVAARKREVRRRIETREHRLTAKLRAIREDERD